ncbi:hypothetical protein [Streptomyces canus]|uniref:hypothetical protein n=1 Tax=Streptomyces canus TaxID=58343 RepID=UPI001CEDC46F|nr:hypothetical protein [Streptomyces canus]
MRANVVTVAGTPRSRSPFPDEVAQALADEANLQQLASGHDPHDRGLRDMWETIIVTGRRANEVIQLRLDCVGRYGGLPCSGTTRPRSAT